MQLAQIKLSLSFRSRVAGVCMFPQCGQVQVGTGIDSLLRRFEGSPLRCIVTHICRVLAARRPLEVQKPVLRSTSAIHSNVQVFLRICK